MKSSGRQNTETIDRLPPHDAAAEKGVLGCILIKPDPSMLIVTEKLPSETAFYDLRHQSLFRILTQMFFAHVAIDLITVDAELADKGLLESIGGIVYLNEIVSSVPSAENLPYYLEIVSEKWLARRTIQLCSGIISDVFDGGKDLPEILGRLESQSTILTGSTRTQKLPTMRELVQEFIADMDARITGEKILESIPSGFPDLDRLTAGFFPGEMIVLAGRPSVGKSAIALNICEKIAIDRKLPVGIFSLEMTAKDIVGRIISSRSGINGMYFRQVEFLAEASFGKITLAAGKLASAPIIVDDDSTVGIADVRSRAREMVLRQGVRFIVIDYLQLLSARNMRGLSRQQDVAEMSSGVKAMAKELKVPVLALCQLNRAMEREDRKPRLSDIRESGNVEADADAVLLLSNPKTEAASKDPNAIAVDCEVAKQRHGPTGIVHFVFLKSLTRFESAAKFTALDSDTRNMPSLPYVDAP